MITIDLLWLTTEKPTIELPISIFNKNPYHVPTSALDPNDSDDDYLLHVTSDSWVM